MIATVRESMHRVGVLPVVRGLVDASDQHVALGRALRVLRVRENQHAVMELARLLLRAPGHRVSGALAREEGTCVVIGQAKRHTSPDRLIAVSEVAAIAQVLGLVGSGVPAKAAAAQITQVASTLRYQIRRDEFGRPALFRDSAVKLMARLRELRDEALAVEARAAQARRDAAVAAERLRRDALAARGQAELYPPASQSQVYAGWRQ